MLSFKEMITFYSRNEHVLEHDLKLNKNYSAPKIYDASGDLTKQWYVYFSIRNPTIGKLHRTKNIYGKANQYTTKEDRIAVLSVYRNNLLSLLKEGYNPFEDNTALYEKRTNTESKNLLASKVVQTATKEVVPFDVGQKGTSKAGFDCRKQ